MRRASRTPAACAETRSRRGDAEQRLSEFARRTRGVCRMLGIGKGGFPMSLRRRMLAELFGTFWLVFGGCGSAVLGIGFPIAGIGIADVSFAFGLTVLTMAYAIGHISGCHLNPAVTLGLTVARRFPAKELPGYVVAQVVGAVVASAVLYGIASGSHHFDLSAGFAANGFGAHSPGGYSLAACFLAEAVLTSFFLFVIPGATDSRAP